MTQPVVRGAPVMGRSLWQMRALCPGPMALIRLCLVYLILVTCGKVKRQFKLRLRIGGAKRDWWVADSGEIAALWEVFIAEQYQGPMPATAELILDVGANTGAATAWLRTRYPDAMIVAVEPDPSTVERLRRNVGSDPRVKVIEAAISDRDGEVSFAREEWSMVGHVIDVGDKPANAVAVPALSLDSVRACAAPGKQVDLLKLDVEGGEWRALSRPVAGVGAVVLEIHEPTGDGRAADEILTEVAKRDGFELCRGVVPRVRWLVRPAVRLPSEAA